MRTQVAIVGAGPAGLMLAHLLDLQGIDSVIVEIRTREYIENRVRAGVLEQPTVDLMHEVGLGDRLAKQGLEHHGTTLRFAHRSHRIDFTELTGSAITVYGQQEVVKDLIVARLESGRPLLFEASDVRLADLDTESPKVLFVHDGRPVTLEADVVAGCDGFHGVSRPSIPAGVARTFEREYPFSWLGILARTHPSSEELIYANHERGFALHSMRTPEITRQYLQVSPDEKLDEWPDDRIWAELGRRFETDGDEDFHLETGKIFDRGITPMRSFVVEPMQYGRLFLVGDSAHIVPPTGAKGMNLAIADAVVLSNGLGQFYATGSDSGLADYGSTCLRRVWRAEHFSWFMTTMLHRPEDQDPFDAQLQQSQLDYTTTSRAAATSLAENYVGLPLRQALAVGAMTMQYEHPVDVNPPLDYPPYRSTADRAPAQPLVLLRQSLTEITGPLLGAERVAKGDNDLTAQHEGEPIGQRIIVRGQVLDSDGRPVPDTLLEIWQANAAGRYRHLVDQWAAPLDPNFSGLGRTMTDSLGRYEFTSIRPGAYPWGNHHNAWRPAHIHFSLFGRAFTQRLVTQMYFPGDPLFPFDPIYNSAPAGARERMISRFNLAETRPEWALAFDFDIVLRGRGATLFESEVDDEMSRLGLTPAQTVGPYLAIGLTWEGGEFVVPPDTEGAIWLRGTLYDGNGDPVPDGMIETWQADAAGRFDHPDDPRGAVPHQDGFRGFGRAGTGPDGSWAICTVKPGRVRSSEASGGPGGAPCIDLSVFARGLTDRLVTRVYFADEADTNATDPVLSALPVQRRGTLVAGPTGDGYRLDLRLRGANETVFFDL